MEARTNVLISGSPMIIEEHAGWQVCSEARSGREAVDGLDRPDVDAGGRTRREACDGGFTLDERSNLASPRHPN